MTQDERRKRDEEAITAEVRVFLDHVYANRPRLEDGEERRLVLSGFFVCFDGDDEEIYGFTARHEWEREL